MPIPSYLQKRQQRHFFKSHLIHKSISSKYQFIKRKFFSRFHRFRVQDISQVDQITLDFLARYEFILEEENNKIKEFSSQKNTFRVNSKKQSIKEILDWTRRRIKGEVISIIVKDGVITEKVFKTSRGNEICIKRKQLGIIPIILSDIINILHSSNNLKK